MGYIVTFIFFMLGALVLGYIARRLPASARSDRNFTKIAALVCATIALFITAFNSVTVVGKTDVGVIDVFGVTQEYDVLMPGLNFHAPWANVTEYYQLRREFTHGGEKDAPLLAMTSDQNPLTVTVGFATKLNPAIAGRLQKEVGSYHFDTLIKPLGLTAIRDGIAQFAWADTAGAKRELTAEAIREAFKRQLIEQLQKSGLTETEAKSAFTVYPVQLREALPDPKILNSIAEKNASEQDLQRQNILTQIAEREAERRQNEGTGVSNLFTALPEGFSADEIATVLQALATKTRAEAMMKAVENGQVSTIIMNGDTATPASLPTSQK